MKYLSIVRYLLISILLTSSVFSWPDSLSIVLPHAGSKALEFRMNGLFNFSEHLGNGITYKKFNSLNTAIRIGIFYNIETIKDAGKSTYESFNNYQDTLKVLEDDLKNLENQTSVYTTIQFINYKTPYHSFALSYGAGPIIGLDIDQSKAKRSSSYGYPNPNVLEVNNKRTFRYVGLSAMIGVEWFVHKNFSFHSEYHSIVKIGKWYYEELNFQEYESGDWHKTFESKDGPYFSVNGSTWVGVSFYFE